MPITSVTLDNNGFTDLWNHFYRMYMDYDSSGNWYTSITQITIKKPYKTNKIVYIWARSSSRPSSPAQGYQFYNTTAKKLEWYDGSSWHQYDMKQYSDDGTIYLYYNGTITLYKWILINNTGYLSSFTPDNTNFCVMPLVEGGADSTGAKKDDWYYDNDTGYLHFYDGYKWISRAIVAPTLDSYWLYALNNVIYNVYREGSGTSAVNYFNSYYNRAHISVIRTADYTETEYGTVLLDPGAQEQTYDISSGYFKCYGGDYTDTGTAFKVKVEYYYNTSYATTNKCYLLDGTTNRAEYYTTEVVQGRYGSIKSTLTKTSESITYPLLDDTLSLTYTVTPTSTYNASLLRPKADDETPLYQANLYYNEYEAKYGTVWYIRKEAGESTWSSYIELRKLEKQGKITVVSGESSINSSSISIKFLEPGAYSIYASGSYLAAYSSSVKLSNKYLTYYSVYAESKPAIAIVSVTPSEYQQGSTDPLNGLPPYTVIYRDATTDNGSWQIPQASILIEFGDPDDTESVYITNSGTSHITAPNQTHVYNGYGGYTAKLTIVDKRGNVATGSCPFEPNKTARIIKPPTISYSPTSMLQPVLASGQAYVAGDPLPTVTWHYKNGDYEGEKTGEYAELSLLKAGDYTITCTPDGLTTKTWTPTVIARGDTPDDSQTLSEYAVVVLDENHYPIDYCKQATDIQYIEYYQCTDTFSFTIPQTYQYAKYLQEGDLLLIGYKGFARLMEVTCRSLSDGKISISGESAFPQRIALQATKNSTSDGYDTQTYYGEDLIRYFIWTALYDPYPETTSQPREADLTVLETSLSRGGTVTYSARFDTLADIIISLCQSCNLGFTTTMRKPSAAVTGFDSLGLIVTQGEDKTRTSGGEDMVVFAPDILKNCRVTSDSGATGHNVAIAGDWHEGSSRIYKYYGNTSYTGFKRKELFVDGTSADTTTDYTELQRIAELELLNEKQLSIKIQVLPTCQWVFGTDYDVGDVVTLITADRGEHDLQIYSAEKVRRSTGDELYLNLGYESHTAPSLISKTRKENTYARK